MTASARLLSALDAPQESLELAVEGHAIGVTHLERVYWPADRASGMPAITKRELLRYLIGVGPYLLPHIADRPLTLFRWPTGIGGRRVRQKHWELPLPSFVARTAIYSESKRQPDEYILCNNLATLVWLGHMGALELHGWHSRVRPGSDGEPTSTDFTSSEADMQQSVIEYPDSGLSQCWLIASRVSR